MPHHSCVLGLFTKSLCLNSLVDETLAGVQDLAFVLRNHMYLAAGDVSRPP